MKGSRFGLAGLFGETRRATSSSDVSIAFGWIVLCVADNWCDHNRDDKCC